MKNMGIIERIIRDKATNLLLNYLKIKPTHLGRQSLRNLKKNGAEACVHLLSGLTVKTIFPYCSNQFFYYLQLKASY